MSNSSNDKICGYYFGVTGTFNGPPSFIFGHLRTVLDNAHPTGNPLWGHGGVKIDRWGGESTSLAFYTRAELEDFLSTID